MFSDIWINAKKIDFNKKSVQVFTYTLHHDLLNDSGLLFYFFLRNE